jgi:hypothetical protein
MNEDQKQILAEAVIEAFEIIERNLMKVIDEKFDAIIDKDATNDPIEIEPPLSEDDVRCIATDVAREVVNDSTIDISA